MSTDIAAVFDNAITQQLLHDEPLLRFGYTALDGSPRVIPIGYLVDGTQFLMWTIPGSAKVRALEAEPRVAITIDIVGPPPRLLLVRGRADLRQVDGVPTGYLEASHRTMPAEAWAGFDEQVRGLYTSMIAITVTPHWAKLIDFETSVPSAIERLIGRH